MAVTKVIEVVGSSPRGSDDAVRAALDAAKRSIRGISAIEVTAVNCVVRNGEIASWDVRVKISFPVEPKTP